MSDREKVISTLEEIKTQTAEIGLDSAVIAHKFIDEILALLKEQEKPNGKCVNECECWDSAYERGKQDALKEQEAVEPYVTGRGETFETAETWWYACGNCHEALDVNDKYCRHCGTPVLWEGR